MEARRRVPWVIFSWRGRSGPRFDKKIRTRETGQGAKGLHLKMTAVIS